MCRREKSLLRTHRRASHLVRVRGRAEGEKLARACGIIQYAWICARGAQAHPPTEPTAQAKLEMRTDDDAGGTTTALPVGIEPDPEEEFFVKKALRRALDGQVQQKQQAKSSAHQLENQQQQHVLNCVALEMRQERFRDLSHRRDTSDRTRTRSRTRARTRTRTRIRTRTRTRTRPRTLTRTRTRTPGPNPDPNPDPNPHRRDTSEMLSATWKKQGELKKIEFDIEKKV